MNKVSLFIKLYRNHRFDNLIIFSLFLLLTMVISMVLFVQANNRILFTSQLLTTGLLNASGTGDNQLEIAISSTEKVLGIIAISSIIVGVIGGLTLIGFRNSNSEKSLVMMHIWGLQKKDLFIKGLIDTIIFGMPSIIVGNVCGYVLFTHFTKSVLAIDILYHLLSTSSIIVFIKTFILIEFIIAGGNLFFDLKVLDKSPTEFLYERKGENSYYHIVILIMECIGIIIYSICIFHIDLTYVAIGIMMIILISVVLFCLFHLFFGLITKKKRRGLEINSLKDISFCFLCSRNKRDAMLAIVISAGTIILCICCNLIFNVGEILRSAYRDNLGYTSIVYVDNYNNMNDIKGILDNNNYVYTLGYSKLMNYSDLVGMDSEEGQFWALIIDSRTDKNKHFMLPEGTFLAENYFESRCNLISGGMTDIFGSNILYAGNLIDNQYLSLVSYNFLINKNDYHLELGNGFHPIFMMDISEKKEYELSELLASYNCHIDSASEVINELKNGLKKYFDFFMIIILMIIIVTAAIFFTVISQDIHKREKEMYLYRIFGASSPKTQKIVYGEYLIISLVSSLAVSFTIMFWGELYFYFGLGRHFPFSILIIIITTFFATGFVFLCCKIAGSINGKSFGVGVIRDE